jgi:Tfp pilus assembly protein PilE
MRNSREFTLIEMMVMVLIIIILIGIGLAVGKQVQASSELALTKSELKGLQGALAWYEHKTAGRLHFQSRALKSGRLHTLSTPVRRFATARPSCKALRRNGKANSEPNLETKKPKLTTPRFWHCETKLLSAARNATHMILPIRKCTKLDSALGQCVTAR